MKELTMLSLSFFFVSALLAAAANPLLSAADSAPNPVLDIDGEKLRTGTNYYIVPVLRDHGGGLTVSATTPNGTFVCPPRVVQTRKEVDHDRPLAFFPENPKEDVVRVSTDLNINFSAFMPCRWTSSTVWRLDKYDESTGQYFVTIGGVKGNPGPETISSWFKIEEFCGSGFYKLVFCPTVCGSCKVKCGDVGIYIDQKGRRRLALSDKPFAFEFNKTVYF
uniref:Miraculin n=2 Tax=Synsepalum dulcificum TaxID=3743 RepID=MIRA_SYNDU|nr:RecName: Full=Miraculin; Short=MIR; Flags: Precursor [Synsepalum dulcificum]BAA07603.1 miraculin precursor [Synsepalum dulcificum]BAH84844.1 miraculin [Synsepalum dulcificum]